MILWDRVERWRERKATDFEASLVEAAKTQCAADLEADLRELEKLIAKIRNDEMYANEVADELEKLIGAPPLRS